MIAAVEKVVVPVADQESAKKFWTERMGFSLIQDAPYGDERWLEVAPLDRSVSLVLMPRPAEEPRRMVEDHLPHSDVFFTCDDIIRTHRELVGRGVVFPMPPSKMPFGWYALFEDADGTRYALGQRDR